MNKKTDVRAKAKRRSKATGTQSKFYGQSVALAQSSELSPRSAASAGDVAQRVTISRTPALSPQFSDIDPSAIGALTPGNVRRRVLMLGLRGVPGIQGGVEKHVEMLAQELVLKGWGVEVVGRNQYLAKPRINAWRGVRITSLWAPASVSLEAFFHTLFGVFYAAVTRPDIVHIHAVGPGLFTPLARLLGLRVVVTHHGYDYDREKWNAFGKRVLRLGERLALTFANGRIAVSREVAATMRKRYAKKIAHIPNGVSVRPAPIAAGILDEFGLQPRRYIVLVARFVPEKRQLDLIQAYARLGTSDWKLVLIGGADQQNSAYARSVNTMAAGVEGVVLTGFQSGDNLATLFSQAGLFVLPSSHEGMPIALLEALGYGLPVLASDIPANHEVELAAEDYFPVGDINALAAALRRKMQEPFEAERAVSIIHDIERTYAWRSISRDTIDVYRTALGPKPDKSGP